MEQDNPLYNFDENVDMAAKLASIMKDIYSSQAKTNTAANVHSEILKNITKELSKETSAMTKTYDTVKEANKSLKIQQDLGVKLESRQQHMNELLAKNNGANMEGIKSLKIQEQELKAAEKRYQDINDEVETALKLKIKLTTAQKDEYKAAQLSVNVLKEDIKLGEHKFGNIRKEQDLLKEALKLNNDNLEVGAQLVNITVERIAKEKDLKNQSKGVTLVLLEGANALMGKLGFGGLAEKLGLSKAMGDADAKIKKITEETGKAATSGQKFTITMQALGTTLKESVKSMFSLPGLIGMAAGALSFLKKKYEEGRAAAEQISAENVGIARSLGLAQGAATGLAESVKGMGPTVAASKASMEGIYNAMGSTEKLSGSTLSTFIKLNTYAGMSADSLAEFQKMAKISGQDAGVMVTHMASTAMAAIQVNKISISQKKLLEEVAGQSNIIKLNFHGQGPALVNAVALSKKLGIEMKDIEGITSSLLNIEDSLAAQMEAELLTGKSLNLEKAREFALNHDNEGLIREIANQLGDAEAFGRMNVIQQEAFAKSVGMSRDSLAGVLEHQITNKSLQGDLIDGQKDGLASMSSEKTLAEEKANLDRAAQEANINYFKTMKPLMEGLEALGTAFSNLMSNVFSLLMGNSLNGVTQTIGQLTAKINAFANSDKLKEMVKTIKKVASGLGSVLKVMIPLIAAFKTYKLVSSLMSMSFGFKKQIAQMAGLGVMKAFAMAGPILGAAAAIAIGLLSAKFMSLGDDIVSHPPGYGDRVLSTPKGSIALNNNDTIVAGTNLGGGGKQQGSSDSSLVAEMREIRGLLSQMLSKEGTVYLDGNKVGVALGSSNYRST